MSGGIRHQNDDEAAIEQGEIADDTQDGLLLGTYDMGTENKLRGSTKLRARSGRRDLCNRLAAPHQRPGISLEAGAASTGMDSPVSID